MTTVVDPSEALRELIREEVGAALAYAYVYEYVVDASDGSSVSAHPASSTIVPPVTGVPIMTGIGGGATTPAPGTHVGIGFLDGNPFKPRLLAVYDGTVAIQGAVSVQTFLTLGDSGAAPLVHASWLTGVVGALNTFAGALALLTAAPLTPVGATGTTLLNALAAVPPSPTLKVKAT